MACSSSKTEQPGTDISTQPWQLREAHTSTSRVLLTTCCLENLATWRVWKARSQQLNRCTQPKQEAHLAHTKSPAIAILRIFALVPEMVDLDSAIFLSWLRYAPHICPKSQGLQRETTSHSGPTRAGGSATSSERVPHTTWHQRSLASASVRTSLEPRRRPKKPSKSSYTCQRTTLVAEG